MNNKFCLFHHRTMHKNGNVVNVVLSIKVEVHNVKHALFLNRCVHVLKHVSVTREENNQNHRQFNEVDRHRKKSFTIEQIPSVHLVLLENSHLPLPTMKGTVQLRKIIPNKNQHIPVSFFPLYLSAMNFF